MLILQWHCLACSRTTNPVPVPFGYDPPARFADLYCIICREVTRQSAGITETACAPIRTMGEVMAEVREDDAVENGILELLAG